MSTKLSDATVSRPRPIVRTSAPEAPALSISAEPILGQQQYYSKSGLLITGSGIVPGATLELRNTSTASDWKALPVKTSAASVGRSFVLELTKEEADSFDIKSGDSLQIRQSLYGYSSAPADVLLGASKSLYLYDSGDLVASDPDNRVFQPGAQVNSVPDERDPYFDTSKWRLDVTPETGVSLTVADGGIEAGAFVEVTSFGSSQVKSVPVPADGKPHVLTADPATPLILKVVDHSRRGVALELFDPVEAQSNDSQAPRSERA